MWLFKCDAELIVEDIDTDGSPSGEFKIEKDFNPNAYLPRISKKKDGVF